MHAVSHDIERVSTGLAVAASQQFTPWFEGAAVTNPASGSAGRSPKTPTTRRPARSQDLDVEEVEVEAEAPVTPPEVLPKPVAERPLPHCRDWCTVRPARRTSAVPNAAASPDDTRSRSPSRPSRTEEAGRQYSYQ